MNLEEACLLALREKPSSGGRLIERFQAGYAGLVRGRGALVYGALANLAARGEAEVVVSGAGEVVWGPPGATAEPAVAPGAPPSFALGDAELRLVDREVGRLAKGLPTHYFEELRRVVVADADRRVFNGDRLPRAIVRALDDLGPAPAVRRLLRKIEKGGPVPLRLARGRLRWLTVPAAILFVLVALRLFVVGIYTLPPDSVSMAPTLLPAAEGDRWVIASLFAYWLAEPERGDVVIFRLPHHADKLVKRVMGLPGETVEVRGEDVLVNGKTLVKDRAFLDRVKVALFDRGDFERFGDEWRQQRPVHAGMRDEPPRGLCRDIVVTARVAANGRGSATFVLDDGGAGQTLVMRPGGGSAALGRIEVARGPDLALEAGQTREVWFTNADGVFRVEVDGREVARAPLDRPGKPGPRVRVHLEGEVELAAIEVARDLVYQAYEGGLKLREDEYFVLGDNSPESRDSRHFKAVPRSALIGRVFAAWPPRRIQ